MDSTGVLVTLLSPEGTGVNGSAASGCIASGTGVIIRSAELLIVERSPSSFECLDLEPRGSQK